MAIQSSDDSIPQTVNALPKNKKSHVSMLIICIALRCISMLNFNEVLFILILLFHAPNYTKITISYRHCNDVCVCVCAHIALLPLEKKIESKENKNETHIQKKGIYVKKENERFKKWSMANLQRDVKKGWTNPKEKKKKDEGTKYT